MKIDAQRIIGERSRVDRLMPETRAVVLIEIIIDSRLRSRRVDKLANVSRSKVRGTVIIVAGEMGMRSLIFFDHGKNILI